MILLLDVDMVRSWTCFVPWDDMVVLDSCKALKAMLVRCTGVTRQWFKGSFDSSGLDRKHGGKGPAYHSKE